MTWTSDRRSFSIALSAVGPRSTSSASARQKVALASKVATGPREAAPAAQPAQPERGQARRDEGERLGTDPHAERGERARDERRAALGGAVQETEDQAHEEDEEQQQDGMMIGAAEARVGEHRRLHQERQAGEQTGVAIEHRRARPVERDHAKREEQRTEQDPHDVQRALEAERRLEQPGAGVEQGIERPGPVLDVAGGRVDPQLAGIEPGAAVVQREHPIETHVGVGIGQRAVEHRGSAAPGEQRLAQDQAGERQQDQPAERGLVGRNRSGGRGRRRGHGLHSTR